jgi:hypothetical protein
MTGVELIVAALAAGAASGVTDTASSMVRDTYSGVRDMVRRRVDGHAERDLQTLAASVAEPAVWQARIDGDLIACGADPAAVPGWACRR